MHAEVLLMLGKIYTGSSRQPVVLPYRKGLEFSCLDTICDHENAFIKDTAMLMIPDQMDDRHFKP